MSISPMTLENIDAPLSVQRSIAESNWYAIQTRARHEKRVARHLREYGVTTFLPLLRRVSAWSDRKKRVEVPLFSCYTFVQVALTNDIRMRILRAPSVLRFVGGAGKGAKIPDEQIGSIRTILKEDIPCAMHPFLCAGKRVRIRGGCLEGVEGILSEGIRGRRLVISVEILQRSLSIEVEGYRIEPA